MSHCLNPKCLFQNPINNKFCQKCGAKLLLAERYRAIKIIGQGGFGRTFLALDEFKLSNPPCVIKQFLPQVQGTNTIKTSTDFFKAEAASLNELGKHPQIPELLTCLIQDEKQYLVQEFIDGENLTTELHKNGKFNEKQIINLLIDILNILYFVHSKQIIHRDIKPGNIIRRNVDKKLVLVDFGSARVILKNEIPPTKSTVIGTSEYMAPEQALGNVQYASDLYSLGMTCIHLLTKVSPSDFYDIYEGDWVWRKYLAENKVSDELGQILDKLIVSAIKHRFQSAQEVLNALNTTPIANQFPVRNLITKKANYTKLRDLMAAGKWKEADYETYVVICQALGKEEGEPLWRGELSDVPSEDWQIIDQLWVYYSKRRFGFSVQKKILKQFGWEAFCDQVGWKFENIGIAEGLVGVNLWLKLDLAFELNENTPWGYLPNCVYWFFDITTLFHFYLHPAQYNLGVVFSNCGLFKYQEIPESFESYSLKLLNSETSFSYTKLWGLLKEEQWEKANEETGKLILKIANREKEGWLREEDCKNFPRKKLKIIDSLWVELTQGRFGFSVQKKIWIECDGIPGVYEKDVWGKFSDRIGWRKEGYWFDYSGLTFNKNAPTAHLPFILFY